MKENVLGYAVDRCSVDECATSVLAAVNSSASAKRCTWLACLNPHSYAVARDDALFARALRDADWLVPDGAGVVLASRLLGGDIRKRVTGSDVFCGLHRHMDAVGGMSVFLLGATDETLELIRARMAKDYPNIRVAGTYSPPFKPVYSSADVDKMIEEVNAAAPDVLWLGLTAPKQEKWIFENRARLNAKFAGAVGAVFDFYSGKVRRSSPVFQRLGLEWLPRLIQQPGRLWRRMLISAPVFVLAVLRAKVRRPN